jgi:sugar phosphate isomerase/epimerase
MKMGYATMSFGEQPIDIAIGAISRLGFDGIELCTWKGLPADLDLLDEERQKEIKYLAEEAGLIINAVGGHVGYIETDEKKRIASINRTKNNIDLAVELGATVVDTFSGASRQDIPEERAWELLVDSISDCADYGAERGVFIGFEPHIGMLVDTPEKVLRLLSSVKSSSLKVNLDVSHFAIFGLHIPDVVRLLSRHMIHTHLKDVRGVYPEFEFLIPGEGDLNIREFVMALKENGYDGFVTSEISVMRQRWCDYDPFYAAELTHRTVSYVFKELGLGH